MNSPIKKASYFRLLLSLLLSLSLFSNSSISSETKEAGELHRQDLAPKTYALFSPHQGEKAFKKIYKSIKEAKDFIISQYIAGAIKT